MILIAAIISAFSFQVQDTIPPPVPPVLPDTLNTSAPDTLEQVPPAISDTLNAAFSDTLESLQHQEPEEEPIEPISFWNYTLPGSFSVAETDSTIRWINMVNLFTRFHQERGAITYRLGTTGRPDAMDLHGFETRHLRAEMEGLRINDPLTGNINWNRLPTQKIYRFSDDTYGATYRSEIRLKDYYLTQPRTYLNFDESKYDYRNLDFVFTQNLKQNTNIELSFWDRRDGIGYNRSNIEGRQAAVLIYHQLNHNWMVKGGYLNNAIDRSESFGYIVSDPAIFTFNRFIESAIQNNASANRTSSDIWLQAHHRKDQQSAVSTELGLHYQSDKWSLTQSSDTLATAFSRAEVFVRQKLRTGGFSLTGSGRAFYLFDSEKKNLAETSWSGGRFDLDVSQKIFNGLNLHVHSNTEIVGDTGTSSELSGRITMQPFRNIEMSGYGGLLRRAPDLQSLYWQSNNFEGDPDLLPEETITIGAEIKTNLLKWFRIGVRGDIRETDHAVFVNTANRFVNADSYLQISTTGWIGLKTGIFEGEISATYKSYETDSQNEINVLLNSAGDRTLMKGHLYWKNYVFNRAAFVTAGISGVFSPNAFRTAEYLVPLNRWQHGTNINRFQSSGGGGGTNTFYNPSYYRADFDVSARIRWFMLLLKWENIFDRMNQAGYFETTGYPMPERRFMLGLRILFTN